ncbi:ESX secretion-associated protein EspG [Qaidamihabitans albus]|uniref:ESX secretion-associated protein EspG n=1 Tax=Qaidamihabitans albus TaxID=2795733 RepID=UPI0018F2669F|nr:ESX secretion-associated protein EspG [Qaidamihabitans albus]
MLHPGELYFVWSALGLGDLPAVLEIPHAGRTAAARAELIGVADRALAERGLGTVAEPAADLAAMLRALAAPELRLDLQTSSVDGSFRAIGAAGPGGVVAAGVADADVRLGPLRRPQLVPAMFDALAPLPAGVGSPGNVRSADYTRACRHGEVDGAAGFLGVLRNAGVRPPEANTLLRALTKRSGGGWFGASVAGRNGQWLRAPSTVNWVDTDEGRYALRRGGDWVTVTPVDPPRLLSMAEEMVASLA